MDQGLDQGHELPGPLPIDKPKAGRKPGRVATGRDINKTTSFNEKEVELVQWAQDEVGLDWSSFLRFAALRYAREVNDGPSRSV